MSLFGVVTLGILTAMAASTDCGCTDTCELAQKVVSLGMAKFWIRIECQESDVLFLFGFPAPQFSFHATY